MFTKQVKKCILYKLLLDVVDQVVVDTSQEQKDFKTISKVQDIVTVAFRKTTKKSMYRMIGELPEYAYLVKRFIEEGAHGLRDISQYYNDTCLEILKICEVTLQSA